MTTIRLRRRATLAGLMLAGIGGPVMAADFKTADGSWTFSIDGNVNADYIYSSCQSASSAASVAGGLACVGGTSGNSISTVGNGLLPAAISLGVTTTQDGFDIEAHFGLYPGITTNDGGSPNLQSNSSNGSSNTALGSGSIDIRQVYLTFGNKDMGTVLAGRNIGLFGADVILNDMTLPGVGVAGGAASAAPSNTTLGSIGFGYIYTDWLAQIDYSTPDFNGFNATVGIFNPINSLSDAGVVQARSAPGVHAKVSYTAAFSDTTKLYLSVAALQQKQNYAADGTSYSYSGTGVDVFGKLDVSDLELVGYYYHATGLGTTALFLYGDANGQTRTSDGYLAQATYKFGKLKLGVNYGVSNLDLVSGEVNPALVSKNSKVTGGLYYSLTKNLMLLGEYTNAKAQAHSGQSNTGNTINAGVFLAF